MKTMIGDVTESPDYSAADLKVLTLHELVMRRPAMFFGDSLRPDWPLLIVAWTVIDLLDYTVGADEHVDVALQGPFRAARGVGRPQR